MTPHNGLTGLTEFQTGLTAKTVEDQKVPNWLKPVTIRFRLKRLRAFI